MLSFLLSGGRTLAKYLQQQPNTEAPVSTDAVGDESQFNLSLVMCRMVRVVITKCPA